VINKRKVDYGDDGLKLDDPRLKADAKKNVGPKRMLVVKI